MCRWILEQKHDIRALVHTDNVIFRATVEEIPEKDFFACVDRNAKSAFMTTKVFAEEIAKAGGGSVVYLSSVHGEKPTGVSFAYSVGKGAVKMLCREMALFYGRKGVRCNVVEMDATCETAPLLDSTIVPFNYELERKVPLGKATRPEDFAGAVAFLVSDDAAQVNGADLLVDGGHLRWYLDR
jgi:NAD(P)-dependent dehydrogenase (short-subunit alcohol dehydrogenase family)